MQVIIHPNETTVSIIRPLDCGLTIQEIARKDVPFGAPYLIIDKAEIPTDRTYRGAWTVDFSNPNGVGLGPHRWWIEKCTAEIARLESQEQSEERAAAIARLQACIDQMKAEVLELDGVEL